MIRRSLDPEYFSSVKSLDEFTRVEGISLSDRAAREKWIAALSSSVGENIANPARLYGFRTESMFAYVAGAMGACRLINEEDAGEMIDSEGDLARPDFRIVTLAEERMLVEVKNFHQRRSRAPLHMTGRYLARLKRYASINAIPLRIAVYWSRWNLWTLLDADRLDETKEIVSISMCDAFLHNEMYLLGDCMIGTTPPLSFRLYADKGKPRIINCGRESGFTVANVSLCCAGKDIDDPIERQIAWFILLNGKWQETEEYYKLSGRLIDFYETQFWPLRHADAEPNELGFESVGNLSQMISSQYLRATSDDKGLKHLVPNMQPGDLGITIPRDYRGRALRLWRFLMLPKNADRAARERAQRILPTSDYATD